MYDIIKQKCALMSERTVSNRLQPVQHGGFGWARYVIQAGGQVGEGREIARRLGREQRKTVHVFAQCSRQNRLAMQAKWATKATLTNLTLRGKKYHVPKRDCYRGLILYRRVQMWHSLRQNLKSATCKSKSIFKSNLSVAAKTSFNP